MYITNLEDDFQKNSTKLYKEQGRKDKKPAANNRLFQKHALNNLSDVYELFEESGREDKNIEAKKKRENKKNMKESSYTNIDGCKEKEQAKLLKDEKTKYYHEIPKTKDAKFMKHLRTFGEMAVVVIHEGKKMRSKLDNKRKTCMFVGYADDHSGDVYRFLIIHTKRIIMSRDARWLNIIWKHHRMKNIYARNRWTFPG